MVKLTNEEYYKDIFLPTLRKKENSEILSSVSSYNDDISIDISKITV
jgi:hypothetical protein